MAETSRLSVIASPDVRPPAHGFEQSARHADRASPLAIVPEAANDSRLDHFVERDGMRFAGTHLIVDLWYAAHLDNLQHVEQALRDATERAGATLLNIDCIVATDGGTAWAATTLARRSSSASIPAASTSRRLCTPAVAIHARRS